MNEVSREGVVRIAIDLAVPGGSLLDCGILEVLERAVEAALQQPNASVLVFHSASAGFCARDDAAIVASLSQDDEGRAELQRRVHRIAGLLRRIETAGRRCVAAIGAGATGSGLELALACHARVAVERSDARFGFPELARGLMPFAGGTQRLPRTIGAVRALRLLGTARTLSASEAAAVGVLDRLCPADALLDTAVEVGPAIEAARPWDCPGYRVPGGATLRELGLVEAFAAANARAVVEFGRNQPAVLATLSVALDGLLLPFDVGVVVEQRMFRRLARDRTLCDIVRATARRFPAEGAARGPIRRVGIVGAGIMGSGIAYATALRGHEVTLVDRSSDLTDRALQRIRRLVSGEVRGGRVAAAEGERLLTRVSSADRIDALAEADLVIEAVFEDRAVKEVVLAQIEQVVGSHCVLASNTSTLPIGGLAAALREPRRFLGLHFFSPVHRMALVEVIRGPATAEPTLRTALEYVGSLDKQPIVVRDGRGFYTTRVFATFTHEGLAMLAEGVRPALIENSARQVGMPLGPLAVVDEVTLGLFLQVDRQARADLGSAYVEPPGLEVVRTLHDRYGRAGRPGGAGFYDYADGARTRLWSELTQVFTAAPTQPDPEDVRLRLLDVQALEASRCLAQGTIESALDADAGAVLGWGFPAWTGGPLSWIDRQDTAAFVARCDARADRLGPRYLPDAALRERAARRQPFHR